MAAHIAAGGVKLRRELIAGDADRSDHRLGRQRPALEAVDADDGAGPGHLLELLLQRRRVVRQRVDLIARQRRPERRTVAVRGRLLLVLLDVDRRLDALNRQHRDLPVVAGPDAHVVQHALLEARKFDFDGVAAGCERRHDRDAGVDGLHRFDRPRLRRIVGSDDGDGGPDDHGIRLIDDRDPQRAPSRLLDEERQRDDARHFGASNFLGSIFKLTLIRSNVVSSIVLSPTARRIRKGHFVPFTSR